MPDDEEKSEKVENILEKELETETLRIALSEFSHEELLVLMDEVDAESRIRIFEGIEINKAGKLLETLPNELRKHIVLTADEDHVADALEKIPPDVATDLLLQAGDEKRKSLLSKIEKSPRQDIERLLVYPKHSAGGIMNTDYVAVPADWNCEQVLKAIRGATDAQTVEDIFVVEDDGKLISRARLIDVISVEGDVLISTLADTRLLTVTPLVDQEEVANIWRMHNPRSLPVVSDGGKLLGVISSEDIIHVVHEEASEDIHKMAGATQIIHPLHTAVMNQVKARYPWLFLTLIGELFIAFVISRNFLGKLEQMVFLASFLPPVMALGGNMGSQSSTIIVRALGMGTISEKNFTRVVIHEGRAGLIIAILLGAIAFLVASGLGYMVGAGNPGFIGIKGACDSAAVLSQSVMVGIAVGIAMVVGMFMTSVAGTIEPLILHRFKIDPAVACGPFISFFNDLFGSITYLLIASLMFPI